MNISSKQNIDHITFIGGGNMASALIKGLLNNGGLPSKISVIDPSPEVGLRIKKDFSIQCISDPKQDASWQTCNFIVWAVKPQQMKEACDSLAQFFCNSALHLSVAAGIPSSSLVKWLGTKRIVRAMPNTPALIGLGQSGLFALPGVTNQERQHVENIMKGTGQSVWIEDEKLLDVVTAVSGSGPAYVFYFLEALAEAGVELGLDTEVSKQLAIGTFIGAGQLALQSNETLSTLRERVTSKGGTTEAALNHMKDSGISGKFKEAVKAAQEKAFQLGVNYGN